MISTNPCSIAFIGNFGGGEIILIFLIVLLLFGAKKVPELFRDQVHSNIKSYAISSKDGIDVSDSLNEYQSEYIDGVHLSQSGRKIVAQEIFESNTFIEAVKSCKN